MPWDAPHLIPQTLLCPADLSALWLHLSLQWVVMQWCIPAVFASRVRQLGGQKQAWPVKAEEDIEYHKFLYIPATQRTWVALDGTKASLGWLCGWAAGGHRKNLGSLCNFTNARPQQTMNLCRCQVRLANRISYLSVGVSSDCFSLLPLDVDTGLGRRLLDVTQTATLLLRLPHWWCNTSTSVHFPEVPATYHNNFLPHY